MTTSETISVSDLDAQAITVVEIEACELQADVDWFPGDWQICRTDL